MSNPLARDESGKPNLRAYENNGFLYGLPIGALIGTFIAGPHFYEWPVWGSIVAILGSGIGGGILGYFAISIAYGSEASGANYTPNFNDEKSADEVSGKASDGSDSGGSGESGDGD